MGSLMTFLVTSAETETASSFWSFDETGNEPPPHLHYDQDEVYYILEGELEVYCMGEVRRCGRAKRSSSPEPGARVLLPVAHPPVPRPVATGRSDGAGLDALKRCRVRPPGTT